MVLTRSERISKFFLVLTIISLFLAVSPVVFGLKVFPSKTVLGDNYFSKQSLIFTVLNDGPKTEQVSIIIDADSYYLKDYVKVEPEKFTIKPNSKKNIQLTTFFPKNLSPEKHDLILKPVSSTLEGEEILYTFTVPGIAKPSLRLENVEVEDIKVGESLIINVLLNNDGNVIARALPQIVVFNKSIEGTLDFESRFMIMPFSKFNVTLLYDASDLSEGKYELLTNFDYNGGKKIESDNIKFYIEGKGSKRNSPIIGKVKNLFGYVLDSFKYIALFLVIVLGGLSIRPEYVKKLVPNLFSPKSQYSKEIQDRVELMNQKSMKLEKELNHFVKDANLFIESSNKWLKEKYGDEYEFR